jgi:hypothetical protein
VKGRFLTWAILVTLVLAACGGGGADKVSPEDYASSVCSNLKTWLTDVQRQAGDIKGAVSPDTPPQEGQQILANYLDEVLASTDRMIKAIEGAGIPDVPNGEVVARTLTGALDTARSTLQEARDKVDSLPTDSREAFAQAAAALGQTITSKVGEVTKAFEGLNSAELDRAFNEVAACRGS